MPFLCYLSHVAFRPRVKIPTFVIMPIAHLVEWIYKLLGPYGMKLPQLIPSRIRLISCSKTFDCSKAKDRLGYAPIITPQVLWRFRNIIILYALMLYHGHSLCFFILWKKKKHNEKLANSRPSKSLMITSWDYLIYHEIKYEMLLLNGDISVHQGSYIYSSEHTLIILFSWCFTHNNEIVIFLVGGFAQDNWIIHTLDFPFHGLGYYRVSQVLLKFHPNNFFCSFVFHGNYY